MEKNEPLDPADVRVLGVATEVAGADGLTHTVKELGLLHFRGVWDSKDPQERTVRGVGSPLWITGYGFLDHRCTSKCEAKARRVRASMSSRGYTTQLIGIDVKMNLGLKVVA
jgi:hypothetical protein